MKNFFIIFLGFCGLFFNNGSKAAEKINIKFEEMKIPLTIEQLSKLEKYKDDSTELIDWLKKNDLIRFFEFSKFLKFPVFKEEGLNREVLRSWIGRKILTELSKTITVPNDNNGTEIYNTIENLLDEKKEISILEIIKALPSEDISLDFDNLILIISSWKNELSKQQDLISKLNNLERTNKNNFKNTKEKSFQNLIKIDKKIYAPHRSKPFQIEIWKSNKTNDKELIIFMPGLGGEINNFKWIGNELAKRGWPIAFLDHRGSNLESFVEVLEGKEAIPGSADFFLYRIKDLDALIKAHENGEFGFPNDSYILMGHSLGALIALLYEGNKPTDQLEEKCDSALKDLAVTNLSKLLQCQLSEIPFPEKNNTNKASAIIGFNAFGSLLWPTEKDSGIKIPTLLIGGTYDLITPLINEQFVVFSALNNLSNRFLIIEGASHFSPIRINDGYKENNDVFKISEFFIGSDPILVQDLSAKFIVEFLKNIKDQKIPTVVKNQRDFGLDFHLLDLETIKEVSKN
ncbi:dienelactone hydrolase [Prochlorococcus marinus str. MU1404]|uniref:alpha/beta hydrolase n=1 Tax=Prochlorococcus marinus TaxID=1219 RepID=UPI001ADB883D|nr:alpha/beta hydrolase [Prochlorococcus marinus XMU1404]MBW3073400.1 dienelactone hydrolase [Prochlorococcus marinus str. MU1404]MCR8545369.1 alpha/beta hydrolase [Prochlorococcus marinus CUG1432]